LTFIGRRIQGRERAWQDSFTAYAGSRRRPNLTLRGRRAFDNECAGQLQRASTWTTAGLTNRAFPRTESRCRNHRAGHRYAVRTLKASVRSEPDLVRDAVAEVITDSAERRRALDQLLQLGVAYHVCVAGLVPALFKM
jgi:hypothetical protein